MEMAFKVFFTIPVLIRYQGQDQKDLLIMTTIILEANHYVFVLHYLFLKPICLCMLKTHIVQ